jgi:hypothetical protein
MILSVIPSDYKMALLYSFLFFKYYSEANRRLEEQEKLFIPEISHLYCMSNNNGRGNNKDPKEHLDEIREQSLTCW